MIEVLASYGLDGEDAFYAALEFWAALHGFVLLEMTGVMDRVNEVDTDAVFSDMVLRLATGMAHRNGWLTRSARSGNRADMTRDCGKARHEFGGGVPSLVSWRHRAWPTGAQAVTHARTPGKFACPVCIGFGWCTAACDTPGRGVSGRDENCSTET